MAVFLCEHRHDLLLQVAGGGLRAIGSVGGRVDEQLGQHRRADRALPRGHLVDKLTTELGLLRRGDRGEDYAVAEVELQAAREVDQVGADAEEPADGVASRGILRPIGESEAMLLHRAQEAVDVRFGLHERADARQPVGRVLERRIEHRPHIPVDVAAQAVDRLDVRGVEVGRLRGEHLPELRDGRAERRGRNDGPGGNRTRRGNLLGPDRLGRKNSQADQADGATENAERGAHENPPRRAEIE